MEWQFLMVVHFKLNSATNSNEIIFSISFNVTIKGIPWIKDENLMGLNAQNSEQKQ